jgi:hypothetical protein
MKTSERAIERHGGVLLVLVGGVLIGLATWQAVHSAVASVFAFCGVAMVVLGVVLERVEGAFELAPTGLKATLRAVQQLEIREDLTFEEKADELLALIQDSGLTTIATAPPEQHTTEGEVDGREASKIFPVLQPYVVGERSAAAGFRFEQFVAAAFREAGWDVKPEVRHHGYILDFEANRAGLTVFVETKLMRARFGAADAERFLGVIQPMRTNGAQYVLVVPIGALTANARVILQRAGNLSILEAPIVWEADGR